MNFPRSGRYSVLSAGTRKSRDRRKDASCDQAPGHRAHGDLARGVVSNPYTTPHDDWYEQERGGGRPIGRFTQPDPSGQEANTYLYGEASPCNGSDPTGLRFVGWSCTRAVIGVLAGTLATGLTALAGPITGGLAWGATAIGVGLTASAYLDVRSSCPRS